MKFFAATFLSVIGIQTWRKKKMKFFAATFLSVIGIQRWRKKRIRPGKWEIINVA